MRFFVCLFLLLLFLFPKSVFAANSDIVVNEVSPDPDGSDNAEFIELYNKGTASISITGWKLSDTSSSTSTYTIPDSSIEPGDYKSFTKSTTGISLNNDGDGVVLKDNTDQQIDSMSYGASISGKSWSRIPNGTGSFVNNTSITQNAENSAPPTPTPTPTSGPSATNTPTPTKTPTPSPTSAPTPTPKTPTPTVAKSISVTPELTNTMQANSFSVPNLSPTSGILGANDDLSQKNNEDSNAPKPDYNWGKLFIIMGVVLIASACGILLYNNFKKNKAESIESSA